MSQTERAVFNVHIRGSIDAVWREITKTDEPQGAFFNMVLHTPGLEVGAPMRMRTRSGKYTGAVGKVIEYDPPHVYAHTFRFTNLDDPECVVRYRLKEVEGGVDFTLEIENLPAGTKTAKQMSSGGKMIVSTLKRIVETGRPAFGIRMLYVLFRLMEPLTPKKSLTSNWP
ncbi:MAG: SRPBCC domain-containing protein [Phycisphaerales bacterium JB039]